MTISQLPPRNGQEYTIMYGDYRAIITEQGASLRKFMWRDLDIVVPYAADQLPPCVNGQVLVPFPNRIAHATYEFEGKQYVLPIDEHERNNAIHGYGYRHLWTLERLTESSITMHWRAPNMAGYPFDIFVTITYALDDQGLHVTLSATNCGECNAPWGAAIHPWLANGGDAYGDAIDALNAQCSLQLPARTHVVVNDNLIPIGIESVEGTPYDYRNGALLDHQPIDDAWTDLDHEPDGTVRAVFTRLDGIRVQVRGDETITSYQVCDASGFPEAIHPCGMAVEPQTTYANAFNTGIDLIVLAPGATTTTNMLLGILE